MTQPLSKNLFNLVSLESISKGLIRMSVMLKGKKFDELTEDIVDGWTATMQRNMVTDSDWFHMVECCEDSLIYFPTPVEALQFRPTRGVINDPVYTIDTKDKCVRVGSARHADPDCPLTSADSHAAEATLKTMFPLELPEPNRALEPRAPLAERVKALKEEFEARSANDDGGHSASPVS